MDLLVPLGNGERAGEIGLSGRRKKPKIYTEAKKEKGHRRRGNFRASGVIAPGMKK